MTAEMWLFVAFLVASSAACNVWVWLVERHDEQRRREFGRALTEYLDGDWPIHIRRGRWQ